MVKTKAASSNKKKASNAKSVNAKAKSAIAKKGGKPTSTKKSSDAAASKIKKSGSPKKSSSSDELGPVSLEEARKILRPTASKKKRRSVASPTGSAEPLSKTVTPATVGKARANLEEQTRLENARRVREYMQLMTLMKQRGVKKPSAVKAGPVKKKAPGPPAPGITPLQVFAEGDSWFHYPSPSFGGGVIPRLENLLGVPILSLAKAGDEVRSMLGVTERQIIEKHLRDGSPAGGSWDAMLFSGGGNDIVGDPMALWIRDFDPAVQPSDLVHSSRFETALGLVRAGYEDLIAMRNKLSPTTHLIFHAYDFAIPDGRGVCNNGPWMKPAFDVRKFPDRNSAFEVVKEMLKRFASTLETLSQTNSDITLINAQGTLKPQTSSWHNELHPSSEGFQKMAKIFRDQLKALFPTKVP
ncbi:MAG: hypothetical protein ABL921_34945 [Pirellula sp.]